MKTTTDIHAELLEDQKRVVAELEQIALFHKETGDWEAKPDTQSGFEANENSEADGFEEHERRQSAVAELETTHRNISRALEKIAAGTYGHCEICSAPISPARLSFLPTARTCTDHLDDERTLGL
jgi:DnaK suppressor protein